MYVFIDSDVVISSLISSTGASYFLLHQSQVKPIISSISYAELRVVTERLGIKSEELKNLVKNRFEVLKMAGKVKNYREEYAPYVNDINDAHIVAGAHIAKVKYLISYNLKHFKTDKIKDELDILIMTPAIYLQYLRSN